MVEETYKLDFHIPNNKAIFAIISIMKAMYSITYSIWLEAELTGYLIQIKSCLTINEQIWARLGRTKMSQCPD